MNGSIGLPWPAIRSTIRAHGGVDGSSRVEVESIGGWLSSGEVFHVTLGSRRASAGHYLVKRSPYAKLEAHWLNTVNRRLAATPIAGTVPRLVACFSDDNVVVTDYLTGAENFGATIIRAALPLAPASRLFLVLDYSRSLGEWLGQFHTVLHEGGFLLSSIQNDLDVRFDELKSQGFSLVSRLRADMSASFDRIGPMPAAMSHGDFAPRNVIVANGRAHVIDWEMVPTKPMPILFDLIHALMVIRKRHPLIRSSVQQKVGDALVAGYLASTGFSDWVVRAWRPVKLLTLAMLLSRQVRAARRSPVQARITGKTMFIQQLVKEISHELKHT